MKIFGYRLFEPDYNNFFFKDNGLSRDTTDPKVVVYLKFMFEGREWTIRELDPSEYGKPIWELFGLSREEYYKDSSVGCKSVLDAIERCDK